MRTQLGALRMAHGDVRTMRPVGILDDHNPYPGRGSVQPVVATTRSGTRWAVSALIVGRLWFGGFGSLFAIVGGAWARTELRDVETSTRIPNCAILVGVVGVLISFVLVFA